jgi:trehalose 6-phosphate phosphatase
MGGWLHNRVPPVPAKTHAVFLDFDGTLVDIATTPESVMVPPELPAILTRAAHALSGALAIISGRKMPELRNFIAPASVPLAAEHGALLAFGAERTDMPPQWPQTWNEPLERFAQAYPGVLIERKATGVAVHFRNAPAAESAALKLALRLANEEKGAFEVMEAKMVAELKRRGTSKGKAIESFMATPAFKGRVPIFVADDASDAAGFAAAEALGGIALHVDMAFGGQTSRVRDWLRGFGDLP